MITQLRTQYSKNYEPPLASSESVEEIVNRSEGEYSKGMSYQYRWDGKNREHRGMVKIAMKDAADGVLVVDFSLATGASIKRWYGGDVE